MRKILARLVCGLGTSMRRSVARLSGWIRIPVIGRNRLETRLVRQSVSFDAGNFQASVDILFFDLKHSKF